MVAREQAADDGGLAAGAQRGAFAGLRHRLDDAGAAHQQVVHRIVDRIELGAQRGQAVDGHAAPAIEGGRLGVRGRCRDGFDWGGDRHRSGRRGAEQIAACVSGCNQGPWKPPGSPVEATVVVALDAATSVFRPCHAAKKRWVAAPSVAKCGHDTGKRGRDTAGWSSVTPIKIGSPGGERLVAGATGGEAGGCGGLRGGLCNGRDGPGDNARRGCAYARHVRGRAGTGMRRGAAASDGGVSYLTAR